MEGTSGMNNLKRHIFFELLQLAGRAFIVVKYSDRVVIGKRGFAPEEKENGLVLVFNQRMNFTWDEYGISATLVFGATPQKCSIPAEDIISIYSPELNAQFIAAPQPSPSEQEQGEKEESPAKGEKEQEAPQDKETEKVVKVDFTKKERSKT